MIRNLCLFLAKVLFSRTVSSQVNSATGGRFDPKLGFRLLRDGRVPMRFKMAALALGAAVAAALQLAEMPLEMVLALIPGMALAEFTFDGFEIFAVVLGIASLALPFIAPRELVSRANHEGDGRVFDAAPASGSRR